MLGSAVARPRAPLRLLSWAALLAPLACAPRAHELVLGGETMGSTWSVKVVLDRPADEETRRAILQAIEQQLDSVDRSMSGYRDDSEVSALNRAPAGVAIEISGPLLEVLALSQRVADETGGAFDVTVGPLVDAWGFGPAAVTPRPPAEDELALLRARIGHRLLHVDTDASAVIKQAEGMRIDLNAVAPGYAVDRIAAELERLGLRRYLVEVGGELRAAGLNVDAEPWRIAIEKPEAGRATQRVVQLRDAALATSGDYRNFWVHEGRRYSHEIDPRTLRPVAHSLASVTVVTSSAAEADALATGLIVLGPDEALALAERRNLPVLLLVHEGDDGVIAERTSSAMKQLLGEVAARR